MHYLAIFMLSSLALGNTLGIISPHRKSLQEEMIPAFKEFYKAKYGKKIKVDWYDSGGSENCLRYIKTRFKKNPKSIGIDVFWGGGDLIYRDLKAKGLLQPYNLPQSLKHLPEKIAGTSLREGNYWYASALSSFGIFTNKILLKRLNLPDPKKWQDLTAPYFEKHLIVTDPRRSGSAALMNIIILESSKSWQEGWKMLAAIYANSKKFAHSSSDAIKAVVNGGASAAMSVDFYAYAKIARLGPKNLGFNIPNGQTIINADPVAILKGAPQQLPAQRFLEYILGVPAQQRLLLKPGQAKGPKKHFLGRTSVNPKAYAGILTSVPNPFTDSSQKMLDIDFSRLTSINSILTDFIASVFIDLHKPLQKSWKNIKSQGGNFQNFPNWDLNYEKAAELAKTWHDPRVRNNTMQAWTKQARKYYEKKNYLAQVKN